MDSPSSLTHSCTTPQPVCVAVPKRWHCLCVPEKGLWWAQRGQTAAPSHRGLWPEEMVTLQMAVRAHCSDRGCEAWAREERWAAARHMCAAMPRPAVAGPVHLADRTVLSRQLNVGEEVGRGLCMW